MKRKWMKRLLSLVLAASMCVTPDVAGNAAVLQQNEAAAVTPQEASVSTEENSTMTVEDIARDISGAEGENVTAPAAPATLYADNVTWQSATLYWSAVEGAGGYSIYRKTDGDSAYQLAGRIEGKNNTTYTDSSLVLGNSYAYRVVSYVMTAAGTYVESETPAYLVVKPLLGKAVWTSAAAGSYNSAVLSWQAVEGATGYRLLRAAPGSSTYTELVDVGNALTYTDSSLSTGNVYQFRVQAYRTVNGTKIYGTESDSTAIKPLPGVPVMEAQLSVSGSVVITWQQVAGAAGYGIYRKSGTGDYKRIALISSGTTLSYEDKGLETGKQYTYCMRAYCTVNGSEAWGNYAGEKTVVATLGAPTLTFGDLSSNSITVKWEKISGAQGYYVYRSASEDGVYTKIKKISSGDTLSYKDTGLTFGTTYYYRVQAYTTVNGTVLNGVYSLPAAQTCVPGAVTLSSTAAGTTKVKLTWTKADMPEENSGYYIYRVTDAGAVKVKTCKNTAVSCTLKNLNYGEKYKFKVVAYAKDANGKIILGADSNVLTVKTALAVPAIKSVAASDAGLKVTWKYSSSAEEDNFWIYRSESADKGFKKIAVVAREAGTKTGSYTDLKVTVGKKYYYKIRSTKKLVSGKTIKSGYSEAVSAKAAPSAPKLVVRAEGATSLRLSWNKVKGSTTTGYVNGYVVYRSTSKKSGYKQAAKITSGTMITYEDKGLTPGNTYYYKIRAYSNVNGQEVYGDYSKVQSAKVVPGQVTAKAEALDYTTVKISWSSVEGVKGYRIYRSTEKKGKYKSVKTVAAGTLSYEDKKVEIGTTYYYKIKAFSKKGSKKIFGKYSAAVSATPILNKPGNLQAIMLDSTQVKLTWNAVPGAETYTILRSTSLTGTYKIASEICATNSFIDANITPGNIYYYKVYAVRGERQSEMTDAVTAMVAALDVSATSVEVKLGGSVKVTATPKPAATVVWSSDDYTIAVVSTDGTIYGSKLGTTTVRATANGITRTITVTVKEKVTVRGVDISQSSGTVDFALLKAAGYEYVMLRISEGTTQDKNFEENFKNAKAAGLKVGVYCSSKAKNIEDAKAEATKVLSILGGRSLDYPIVYNMENAVQLTNITNAQRNDMLDNFKYIIIEGGKQYKFALYTTKGWLTTYFDNNRLAGIDLWVINYGAETAGHGYTGKGNVVMWCYTKDAVVNGLANKARVSISYYAN